MITKISGLFLAGLLALPGWAWAQSQQVLNDYLSSLQTLQADFDQYVFDTSGTVLKSSSGKMYMQRPGQFRWHYTQPHEHLIVADGERVWLYDKGLQQVTVRRIAETVGTTPLAVLSGAIAVDSAFSVSAEYERDGIRWFQLTPKDSQADFKTLIIGFADTRLAVIELTDNFAQRTQLRLKNVDQNPTLKSGLFRFKPPPGADVVGDV